MGNSKKWQYIISFINEEGDTFLCDFVIVEQIAFKGSMCNQVDFAHTIIRDVQQTIHYSRSVGGEQRLSDA